MRKIAGAVALLASVGVSGAATAQMTAPVLQPVLNFDYSRGRNTSVNERERPEYMSTGVQLGGFTAFPTLALGTGFTNNMFETDLAKRSSAYFQIDPDLRVVSNWSRNSFQFEAGGTLRRYTATSVRDENGWRVGGAGRIDAGDFTVISLDASTAQQYETRFSGSTPGDTASATPYQLSRTSIQADQTVGRFKITLNGAFTSADFSSIQLLDGVSLDQKFRNRDTYDAIGRVAYALNPDLSVFGQFTYEDASYDKRFATGFNDRNAREYRALGGVSMDLTALVRGSFAIGYTDRHYLAGLYNNVKGLSFETRFEYFPSELTTVTVAGRRVIQDASIIGSSGYFNTGGGVRIDHEFLRNVIANIGLDYEDDSYRGIDANARVLVASGGVRYLFSRMVGIGATVSYGQRHNRGVDVGPSFNETSGLLSLYLQK